MQQIVSCSFHGKHTDLFSSRIPPKGLLQLFSGSLLPELLFFAVVLLGQRELTGCCLQGGLLPRQPLLPKPRSVNTGCIYFQTLEFVGGRLDVLQTPCLSTGCNSEIDDEKPKSLVCLRGKTVLSPPVAACSTNQQQEKQRHNQRIQPLCFTEIGASELMFKSNINFSVVV